MSASDGDGFSIVRALCEATVVQVNSREGEPVEKLLRRFKKKVEAAGILKETRKHEYYLKPSVRKKQKQAAASKRRKRSASRTARRT